MNKKKIVPMINLMFMAPLLMGAKNSEFVNMTDRFDINFTDLGIISSSYKKYSAEITNYSDYPIMPSYFEYQDQIYDFIRANDPFYSPNCIVLPHSTYEFYLIVPKEADVYNYNFYADAFLEIDSEATVPEPYTFSYSTESYDEYERIYLDSYLHVPDHSSEYMLLFDVMYQGQRYYTMVGEVDYGSIGLNISKNTVVNDISVNSIGTYRVRRYAEPKRSINVWPIFLLFFLPLTIITVFAGLIVKIVRANRKKKIDNSGF